MFRPMITALALLLLAGCGVSPASLGITGPAPYVPPAEPDDSTIDAPGLPLPLGGYGPSIGPNQSSGRFFNYN